ncbi:pentatricopeptide repeat-containing protein At5g40400 isoform X2 [Macadamia integrifolia]|uniref:pentatricopeptide repeat-containing protein At5g40400 isoform X2 n=1 Tax=Macadamia integrifolia TaxID=60698 RepID=UPI001C530703|nr:pentatricopeptide repeat-containing protein At5g40400 isoform X2 [Macadamia integrifolia]
MYRRFITPINRIFLRLTNGGSLFSPTAPVSNSVCSAIPLHNFSSSSSSLQILAESKMELLYNPLYSFLPRAHNPYNTVDIICSHLKLNNGDLTFLREDLKWVLPHLGAHDVSRVLLRCQSEQCAALSFFDWIKNDLGFRPTSQNYCIIVHILVWSRNFAQAMKLLSELIEESAMEVHSSEYVFRDLVLSTEGCNWDPVVFDLLIKAYVKLGLVRVGLISFQKTMKIGFVPNVSVCNCLLNGLLKSNHLDCCWKIYKEMGRIGIFPNSYTFNILTHVLCRDGDGDGDVGKVNVFLEKMEEEGFDPDVVTYNTLIDSYCRKGRLDDAFYLYKIMYRRGVPPDLVSYTTLMKGLCKQGKVRDAHQLFHRMVHRGLSPDIISFNSLISGYCKQGKMLESRSLLHGMIQSGIFPDDFTCHTLIEGYVNGGRLLSALNLILELKRSGVLISQDIYCYLIMALCQENRPNAAASLFRRMSQDGYKPSLEVYNGLILSFCNYDDLCEAFLLKDEMVCKGLKPDLITYRALIDCLCRLGKSAEAESLMCDMVASGLFPDSLICRALIKGFCKEEDLDKAESLLTYFAELQDKMLKLGFVPNILTCKSLIHGLSKARVNSQAS